MPSLEGTHLLHACKSNAVDILKQNSDPESLIRITDDHGATCAHYAARSGCTAILEYLADISGGNDREDDDGGDIWEKRTCVGATPLHDACVVGNTDVVEWLLSNSNCSVGTEDNEGITPLHIIARFGHVALLRRVLDLQQSIDLDKKTSTGATLLHLAAGAGHLDTVKFLVENRPYRARDEDLLQSDVLWVLALNSKGSDHGTEGHNDRSCPCCNLDHMTNAQMQCGSTAVYLASQNGHLEVLQYLVLEAGASTKIIPYDGMTCLQAAVQNGHIEVAKWLLKSNSHSLNSKDFEGMTALHFAASSGQTEIMEWLMKLGAKINTDFVGGSPLHSAAQFGHIKCCQILLEHGLDPESTDDEGLTPIELADRCFQYGCAGFITKWLKQQKEMKAFLERKAIEESNQNQEVEHSGGESLFIPKGLVIPPPPAFAPPAVPKLVRQDGMDSNTQLDISSIDPRADISPNSSIASTPSITRKPTTYNNSFLQPPGISQNELTSPPRQKKNGADQNGASPERARSDDGSDVISQLKAAPELRESLRRTKTNKSGSSILFTAKRQNGIKGSSSRKTACQ